MGLTDASVVPTTDTTFDLMLVEAVIQPQLSGPDDCESGHNSLRSHLTLELGEESPILSIEITGPEQAGAPLSPPQTVEASEPEGGAVLDT